MLCLSFLFLFQVNSYFPKELDQSRRNLRALFCCNVAYEENAGHLLTENVLDLQRCRPAISFRNSAPLRASSSHLVQIANILETKLLSRGECVNFYKKHAHPTSKMRAYSKFLGYYDAIEVRDNLRDAQKKILSYCGIDTPSYKHDGLDTDNRYTQLLHRPPSTSVVIVRRGRLANRVLLNSHEILDTCQELDLNCQIIETDTLFLRPESKDLCFVLKKYAHTVTIGMQGAENIYPHYTYGRMLLLKTADSLTNKTITVPNETNTCRYGDTMIADDEVQVAKNLISRPPYLLDWFHLEFASHLGNSLKAISGTMDFESLERVKQTSAKISGRVNHFIAQIMM